MPLTVASNLLARVQEEREAREMQESFHAFATAAWTQIDPAPLVRGWFLDLMWDELDAWGRGDTRKLILSVPPGSAKSISASVLLPAWIWARNPGYSFLSYASTQALAIRDNLRMRDLVTSDWYQRRFCARGGWGLHDGAWGKKEFRTTEGGSRFGLGGLSRPTGWRADGIVIDDPIDANPRKLPRLEDYDAAYQAAQYLLRTRVNDRTKAQGLVIMQRLHESDPVGRLLKDEPEIWRRVYFDAQYDDRMPHRHPRDPRRRAGEVLFPERGMTPQTLAEDRLALGEAMYSAQYQQVPAQAGGMIIREGWIQEVDNIPDYPYTIISWDCAFKKGETSSWVVGTVWKVTDPGDPMLRRFCLIDIVRERLDYAETKRAIERLHVWHPDADYVVIEDKANGPAAISELKHKIPTIVAFEPSKYGDKEQRLGSVAPIFEAGKVSVLKDLEGKEEYLRELTQFPKSADNDQVDSTTQCVIGSLYHLDEWRQQVQGKKITIFSM